ncbi:tyrosine-type recombinase/integrase, partial [Thermodesulfobacteriota bacterium]
MTSLKRYKTKYPGVYYINGTSPITGKPEKIFYIRYRRYGKLIEEKAGRQYQDDMTPARASQKRTRRIQGDELSNEEERAKTEASKKAEEGKWTIDKLWTVYKEQRPDIKGIQSDNYRFENHIKPQFGDKEPKEVMQLDVDRIRLRLLKKLKPQTVKHVLSLLKRISRFGEGRGLCEGLDFKIQMPKVSNLVTEDLTPEQLKALLDAINQDSNEQAKAMMKMALFTGMRRGEILKLEWRDVDFQRGFITIRDPKGGADQKIPLNETAREILETVPRTKSEYVFPGPTGDQKPAMNSLFIKRIKKAAKLPKGFRPMHGLRHVYASMLASSGKVDMYTLQKMLTHKDPRMTQRYAHLRDEALKRA